MTTNAQVSWHRQRELNPRAWVGYLVSYNSSNIYHVWNPVIRQVILIRGVAFNDNKSFDAHLGRLRDGSFSDS